MPATKRTRLNSITPRKGLGVQVYMSRRDIGSGVRPFLIIGVSSRYVTLFYAPKLHVVKIKRLDWPTYHAAEFIPNPAIIVRQIAMDWERAKDMGLRTNKAHIIRALEVLKPLAVLQERLRHVRAM